MEKEKQEYLSITFDIKPPRSAKESELNSAILLLSDFKNLFEQEKWDKFDVFLMNSKIEELKKELDNLKIINFEED